MDFSRSVEEDDDDESVDFASLYPERELLIDFAVDCVQSGNFLQAIAALNFAETHDFGEGEDDNSLLLGTQIVWRGVAHSRLENTKEAIADFTRAMEILDDSLRVYAYDQRACVYTQIDENALAVDDLSKAIELEPDNITRYVLRARYYAKLEQFDCSFADFETVFQKITHQLTPSGDGSEEHPILLLPPEEEIRDLIELRQQAHANRAVVYSRILRDDLAREDLEEAKRIMRTEDGDDDESAWGGIKGTYFLADCATLMMIWGEFDEAVNLCGLCLKRIREESKKGVFRQAVAITLFKRFCCYCFKGCFFGRGGFWISEARKDLFQTFEFDPKFPALVDLVDMIPSIEDCLQQVLPALGESLATGELRKRLSMREADYEGRYAFLEGEVVVGKRDNVHHGCVGSVRVVMRSGGGATATTIFAARSCLIILI